MKKASVLVCVPARETIAWVQALQNCGSVRESSITTSGNSLLSDISEMRPEVVIIDSSVQGFSAELVAQVSHFQYEDGGSPAVIVVMPQSAHERVAQVEDAGAARVILHAGAGTPDLALRAIPEALERAETLRRMPGWMAAIPLAVSNALAAAGQGLQWQRGILAVWSPKGGVGKTTLAANLAAMLGVLAGRPTIALDVNANGGHLDIHMGAWEYSSGGTGLVFLANLFHARGVLTVQDLFQASVHLGKGKGDWPLYLLPGISRPEMASQPALVGEQGERFVRTLLDVASMRFDFVVVDCGSNLNIAMHRACLTQATRIIAVVAPDVPSVVDTRSHLQALFNLGVPQDKVVIVLNFWSPEAGLDAGDIAQRLEQPLAARVPYESRFPVSVNRGVPFVIAYLRDVDPGASNAVEALLSLGAYFYPALQEVCRHRTRARVSAPRDGLMQRFFRWLEGD